MTLRRLVQTIFAVLTIAAITTAVLIWKAVGHRRELVELQQQRLTSYRLADELRHSSDDLTRFARSYVATGDPKFAAYYRDVLSIRNGTMPRPVNYNGAYWDLKSAGMDSAASGRAVALQQLMREAGFAASELATLAESESRSNKLVAIEEAAMRAPDRRAALTTLFDSTYHAEKGRIMAPIDQFLSAVDQRTNEKWSEFQAATVTTFATIEIMLAIFLAIVLGSYPVLSNRILTPVATLQRRTREVATDLDRLAAVTEKIAGGDLGQSYAVATVPLGNARRDEIGELSRLQDSMLAQLQLTGGSIASITAELSRAHLVSKQRFVAIFDRSPVAVAVTEAVSGRFVEVNRAFVDLIGAPSAARVLGKTAIELGIWTDEDRRNRLSDPLRKSGQIAGTEISFRRVSGGSGTAELWASYYEADGGLFVLSSLIDVSARRRAEQEYRELVNGVRDVVFSLAGDGAIATLNPAFERVTGMSASDWIGKPFLDLLHPDDRDRAGLELRQSIDGQAPSGPPLRIRAANGFRYGEVQTAPRIEDGRLVGMLGIGRDVTERISLEEQLRQSQKMDAMGRLAGGIAHDFNNLLTVIIGFGQLIMADKRIDKTAIADVDEMVKAAERAAEMTRQLLTFSRKQIVEPRDVNLSTIVTGVDKMLRRMIGEDVVLKTVTDPDLGTVRADPGQLEQVLANLVVNARDAMPTGGTVTMETANVIVDEVVAAANTDAAPGEYVRLSVTDTGTGMSDEVKTRIFEPFYTTKEVGKGTGLGLSTVFGIVQQNRGFIRVHSTLGVGTTFELFFPRVQSQAAGVALGTTDRSFARGSETILVAEDNTALRQLTSRVLGEAGYTVLAAASAEEAFAAAELHDGIIHLLITDVVMPGMNGRALAEGLARSRPGLRVLYVSGYTDEVLGRHGVLDEGIMLLPKPFTPETLTLKVREALSLPAVSRDARGQVQPVAG